MSTQWTIRAAGQRVALRLPRRTVYAVAVLLLTALATLALSLFLGDFPISPPQVMNALAGYGTRAQRFFVTEVRLPRALVALLAGAAFAAGGAIFQSLTRNPMGSPDIIGFSSGAVCGALCSILLFGSTGLPATSTGVRITPAMGMKSACGS